MNSILTKQNRVFLILILLIISVSPLVFGEGKIFHVDGLINQSDGTPVPSGTNVTVIFVNPAGDNVTIIKQTADLGPPWCGGCTNYYSESVSEDGNGVQEGWQIYVYSEYNNKYGYNDSEVTQDFNTYGKTRADINLIYNVDITPPNINIISPANNTIDESSNTIYFYYNVSDISNISSCSLIIDNVINKTSSDIIRNQTISFNQTLENNNYTWSVNCTDIKGYSGVSETRRITVNYVNSAPYFVSNTTDNSDSSTPTNIGNNLTFSATANDTHNQDYQLVVCNSSLISQSGVCADGIICNSSFVPALALASCQHNTSGELEKTYSWYSFLCDAENCSSAENTNSPYEVNHYPYAYASISNILLPPNSSYLINLSNYFTDSDSDNLGFISNAVSNVLITIDNSTNTANITPDPGWEGIRYINFTTTDEHSLSNTSNTFMLNVTQQNIPPNVDFAGYTLYLDENSYDDSTNLSNYVFDGDTADTDINWSCAGNESDVSAVANNDTKILNITSSNYFYGNVNVTCTAIDDIGLTNTDWFIAVVLHVNHAPTAVNLIAPDDDFNTTTNTTYFNWSDATDPDVIDTLTYFIEIANNTDFSSLERNINASLISNYTLNSSQALSDGLWYWRIKTCDDSGQATNCTYSSTNNTFRVDTSAPDITFDNPQPDEILGWNIWLYTNITDLVGVDTVSYQVVNSSNGVIFESGILTAPNYDASWYSAYNISNASDTNYVNFTVFANDSFGTEITVSVRFIVDNRQPSIDIFTPFNASRFNSNFNLDVRVQNEHLIISTYNITNSTGDLMYSGTNNSINSPTFNWTDIINTASWSEGLYNFTIYAQDEVGNNYSRTTLFYVDRTSPGVVVTYPQEGELYRNSSLYLNVSSEGDIESCIYSLNSVSNVSLVYLGSGKWTDNITANSGSNTVIVYCNDSASNINSTVRNFNVNFVPVVNFEGYVAYLLEDSYNDTTNLSNYVTDVEDSDYLINWSCSVNESNASVVMNNITKILNITSSNDFFGNVTVNCTAIDSGGLNNTKSFIAVVVAVNDAPEIIGWPNRSVDEDTTPTENWIDLHNFSSDVDHNESELNYNISNQTNTSLINCSIVLNRYLNCSTPGLNLYGKSYINITVGDGEYNISDVANITVNPVNDAPTAPDLVAPPADLKTKNNTPYFNITDSTDVDVGDILTYYIQVSNTTSFSTFILNQNNSVSEWQVLQSQSFEDGIWYWRGMVCDDSGAQNNCTISSTAFFKITSDTTPPVVVIYEPDPDETLGWTIPLISNVIDKTLDVNRTWFMIINGSGVIVEEGELYPPDYTYQWDSSGYFGIQAMGIQEETGKFFITANNTNGTTFNYTIHANDTVGNYANASTKFYVNHDIPSVNIIYPKRHNISSDFSLDIRIQSTNLTISWYEIINSSGAQFQNNSNLSINGTGYNWTDYVNITTWKSGIYNVTAYGESAGAINRTETTYFTLDVDSPYYTNIIRTPEIVYNDDTVYLNVTWLDNNVIGSAYIFYDANGTWINRTATKSNNDYFITINPSLIDNHETIFWNSTAVDAFGNWNTTMPMQNFSVSNRAPILNTTNPVPNQTISEDTSSILNITLNFYDPDGDNLTYNVSTVQNITIVLNYSTGIANITPDPDFYGLRYVTFYANDGFNTTPSNNVTLNITNVNDGPIADFASYIAYLDEDSYNDSTNLSNYVSDIDTSKGDINWSCASNETDVSAAVNNITKILNITASNDFYGNTNITCTAYDYDGLNHTDSFTTTISPINDPPVIDFGNYIAYLISNTYNDTTNLSNYVSDIDTSKADINWSCASNETDVSTVVNNDTKILNITGENKFIGNITVNCTAFNFDGLNDTGSFIVAVLPPTALPLIPNLSVNLNRDNVSVDLNWSNSSGAD
ncbi:Ig-like domain-containing protein, partial [Nanoarchaeota archaeon]